MTHPNPPRSLAEYRDALRDAYSPTQQDRKHVHNAMLRRLADPLAASDIEQLVSATQPRLIPRIVASARPFFKQAVALIAAACAGAVIALTQAPRVQNHDAANQTRTSSSNPSTSPSAPTAALLPGVHPSNGVSGQAMEPLVVSVPAIAPLVAPPKPARVPHHRSALPNHGESLAVTSNTATSPEPAEDLQGLEATAPAEPVAAPAPDEQSNLARELGLIRAASSALDRGAPTAALQQLSDHARLFPNGTLAIERRGLELIARCTLDPHAPLRAERDLFLARFPSAPVAARASRACENAR